MTTRNGIIEEVTTLLNEAPREPGTKLPPGASEQDISDFEKYTNLALPESLKALLRICNGPAVGPGGIYGISTSSDDDSRRSYLIADVLGSHPNWRQAGWLPIAGDGCGNEYVLSLKCDSHPVLYVETCTNPDVAQYVVGSDLWHFLRFLLRREIGERGWPFCRDYVLGMDPRMEDVRSAPMPWDVAERP
jgi:cell wall assembly regulator SMI1